MVILSRTWASESLSIENFTCPSHYHRVVTGSDEFIKKIKHLMHIL